MRLSELEEPLESNTQTPSFIYGKSKCTEGKKYGELVGQPGLEPRNLRNEFSVSASHLPTWTVACQASLSMGLSQQEYWSGLPFPLPGDLPNPRIEPTFPVAPALAG